MTKGEGLPLQYWSCSRNGVDGDASETFLQPNQVRIQAKAEQYGAGSVSLSDGHPLILKFSPKDIVHHYN